MKHRHKVLPYFGYHICAVCGARRSGYSRYGYGKWGKNGKEIGQWCPGPGK